MSFIVLKRMLVCGSIALTSITVPARNAQSALSCETAPAEKTLLMNVPERARRVEPHSLEVITKKGSQRFVDKPPHDTGEMAGLHWRYCGFDSQSRTHLVGMTDESSYSGKLVVDETGISMRAGHTVVFSPTRKEFLAIEQEAGEDGEEWAVYDITGKSIWKGYAGTMANVDGIETVVSTFGRPQWTKQGELTARFACASSSYQGTITLSRAPDGNWIWRGHGKCS